MADPPEPLELPGPAERADQLACRARHARLPDIAARVLHGWRRRKHRLHSLHLRRWPRSAPWCIATPTVTTRSGLVLNQAPETEDAIIGYSGNTVAMWRDRNRR